MKSTDFAVNKEEEEGGVNLSSDAYLIKETFGDDRSDRVLAKKPM